MSSDGTRDSDARESGRSERKIYVPQQIWDEVKIAAIRMKLKGGASEFVLRAIRHELFGRPAEAPAVAPVAHLAVAAKRS